MSKRNKGFSSEKTIACILATSVLAVFIYILLNPKSLDVGTLAIVRFLAATCSGLSAYLFLGEIEVKGRISRVVVRASGGFALFLVVFLFFFQAMPSVLNNQRTTSYEDNLTINQHNYNTSNYDSTINNNSYSTNYYNYTHPTLPVTRDISSTSKSNQNRIPVSEIQDLSQTSKSYPVISRLATIDGLITVYPDQSLRLQEGVSRAEFVTVLSTISDFFDRSLSKQVRILQCNIHEDLGNPRNVDHFTFVPSDVKKSSWFYDYYLNVSKKTGSHFFREDLFHPTKVISRAEMAAGLNQIADYTFSKTEGWSSSLNLYQNVSIQNEESFLISQVTSLSQISDVYPGDWFFHDLQSMIERWGVMAGFPDGTFRPSYPVDRMTLFENTDALLQRWEEVMQNLKCKNVT